MKSPASVKEKLKNIAIKTDKPFQELLILYGLEKTIANISKSDYKEKFTLKGGIFLYALTKGKYPRVTSDIDLLAQNIENDLEEIYNIFYNIFSLSNDSTIVYDLKSLKVKNITELNKYHGVNVSIFAFLDKTRIPISIDIGFGDIVFPPKVLIDYPVLFSDEEIPQIYAYSIYTCIAEKFEAIVSLGYMNSRFKDFYDIYVFATKQTFDGNTLLESIKETFLYRQTELVDISIFELDYVTDSTRQLRWNNFIKKKKVSLDVSFSETINVLKLFLQPVVNCLNNNIKFNYQWNHIERKWM